MAKGIYLRSELHMQHVAKLKLLNKGREPWNKGKKGLQTAWNKGLKGYMAGEKNGMWAGDNVGYGSLHSWVYNKLGRPSTCEHCEKTGLQNYSINWANISGDYNRDVSDWLRLCVKCHRAFDKEKHEVCGDNSSSETTEA